MLGAALWFMVGRPYPYLADRQTWLWMLLSGLVGFGFGDYCLFSSYVLIGSRFSQLFMTLASPFAAITAWILLGERMTGMATLGMCITIVGIGMSVLSKDSAEGQPKHIGVKLPLSGFVFGIGAALGQGVGLVLSKVGLEHYTLSAADAAVTPMLMPIGGTMIRTLAGFCCFTFFLIINKKVSRLREAVCDGRGMSYALLATFFGPALGVSLSLLALQYTQAGIAQTIMSLVPVLIILPSRLVFKTKVTAMEVVGAVIAVIGASLFFV